MAAEITLKVATLNLHNRHHRWRERRHLVVAEILDAMPDVLSLQEINLATGQGKWLMRQVNTRISGSPGAPYRLLQERKRQLIGGYFEGIGILTRLPVVSSDAISLGYEGRVALRANVVLSSGETLDFIATHLHHVSHAHQARLEQVMLLTGWVNEIGRVPLQVIAGDFNEVPGGPAIEQMKQTYRSALAQARGYEPLATWPTALVDSHDAWSGCLDYIFISSGLNVARAGLFADEHADGDPTLYPSDHVGLYAVLEVKRRSRRGGHR
ncbi:MAG TPA: endonuclease/exonuclease/phosphatase family protein [Candidatus Sulfomarinibacteraceae bacterium]|nr:endonuclease/exonuclease/phosphatase family protein [Candidatus Sulfomarinibacteraceae bacterium]